MTMIKKTPQPMIYSTNIAKSDEPRPVRCGRSFCNHDHSKDKYFTVGRRPTDGRSLDHHHTRKHAKDKGPHYMTTISCSRTHDVPLNPWHSTNVPTYARAASIFQIFDYLRETKPNSWRRTTSSDEIFLRTQRRRPTNDQSLNYHHTRKHAKDIEPHCFKILKCGRLHDMPVKQWNVSNQPDYKAANTIHRLFGNIGERKMKPRIRQVKKNTILATANNTDSSSVDVVSESTEDVPMYKIDVAKYRVMHAEEECITPQILCPQSELRPKSLAKTEVRNRHHCGLPCLNEKRFAFKSNSRS